jgi:hypothetical protein
MNGRDWSPLRFDCSLPARCAWRRDARACQMIFDVLDRLRNHLLNATLAVS